MELIGFSLAVVFWDEHCSSLNQPVWDLASTLNHLHHQLSSNGSRSGESLPPVGTEPISPLCLPVSSLFLGLLPDDLPNSTDYHALITLLVHAGDRLFPVLNQGIVWVIVSLNPYDPTPVLKMGRLRRVGGFLTVFLIV